jgi:uncharacterized membrane protein (DUF2068 family)
LERKRPVGVTIIAILTIIGGILLLFGGIALVALAPIISQINVEENNNNTSNSSISLNVNGTLVTIPNNALFILGGSMGVVGGMLIAIGIASFVVAWGLFKGKAWAWIVTNIITIISIILNIISVIAGSIESIVGLIINGIIIYYLYRPSVKSYFGRIKAPTV